MLIEKPEDLKQWLTSHLEPLCDADPAALAKYVLALIKKDKTVDELKDSMMQQMDVFLQAETQSFVDMLFNVVETKEYLTTHRSRRRFLVETMTRILRWKRILGSLRLRQTQQPLSVKTRGFLIQGLRLMTERDLDNLHPMKGELRADLDQEITENLQGDHLDQDPDHCLQGTTGSDHPGGDRDHRTWGGGDLQRLCPEGLDQLRKSHRTPETALLPEMKEQQVTRPLLRSLGAEIMTRKVSV